MLFVRLRAAVGRDDPHRRQMDGALDCVVCDLLGPLRRRLAVRLVPLLAV